MITMSLAEFQAAVRAQGVERIDAAFVCPMCRTVQSPRGLIAAGAGPDFDSVQRYSGFSCVGRFTGAAGPRKEPDGQPCNWTLGGLFRMHELEVVTEDGQAHPHFMVATPEQAQALAADQSAGASNG